MSKLSAAQLAKNLGLDPQKFPSHVAIIMDGNGRWAQRRFLPRVAGHRKGADSVTEVVEAAVELNLEALTLFAFSDDNWRRPEAEVSALWSLLERYLAKELSRLQQQNVKLNVIGETQRLPESTQNLLQRTCRELSQNTGLHLTLALSYGGRAEIAAACKKICQLTMEGSLSVDEIDADLFSRFMQSGAPYDVDLLIRTSGEYRISNFLLWQIAYAEMYFTDIFWPDFGKKQFVEALRSFQNRDRRFGAVKSASPSSFIPKMGLLNAWQKRTRDQSLPNLVDIATKQDTLCSSNEF